MSRLLTVKDGLKDNAVQSVTTGPDGALWIAYFPPVGITRIDISGGRPLLRHFTAADGLPSDVVYSQFFDARGRHWLGTDSGVAVLEGGRWTRYDTSDGLVWNDCNAGAFLPEADGSFWLGTSGGLARFLPAAPPKTRAAGDADHLRAAQRSAGIGARSSIPRPIRWRFVSRCCRTSGGW